MPFGSVSRREANSAGFYRRSLDNRNWPQIYPLGFLPVIKPEVIDASATAGVRGQAARWTYDISGTYGRNTFDFTIGDTLNVSLGPTTPPNKTEFDAGSLGLNQFVANVDVRRPFRVGALAGPLNVAFGAEFRREAYDLNAGEPDSYGDGGVLNQVGDPAAIGAQVFPGFRPSNEVDSSRNSVAAYVDVEGDVINWLRLGGAGRVERYSDFGSTVDGKLTVRVQPDRRFVVRGAVSSGFRAPSLAQSFFSSTATNFLDLGNGLVPVESLTLPVASAPAQVLGAVPLKPEQSFNVSGGVVIAPIASFEITIDAYRIAIDDRIVLSGNFTAPRIAELLAPFGANSARFFTNAIDTRTNGVDATVSYHVKLDTAGDVALRAGYNNTHTKVVGSIATPPQLAGFEAVLFDRIERRRLECGQPKDSVRLGGDWRLSKVGVNVNVARYGECAASKRSCQPTIRCSGRSGLTDLEASYRLAGYTLAIGAQNLFNVFPDRNTTVNSFNGIQTFPGQSPFGMNGRTLYGRIAYSF